MILPYIIGITLLIVFNWYFIKKTFSVLKNSILFMITAILVTNYLTILSLNFELISVSHNDLLFFTLVIVRSLTIPLVILYFINFYKRENGGFISRAIAFIFCFLAIYVLEYIAVRFHLISIEKFNYTIGLLLPAGLPVLVLLINILLSYLEEKGGGNHGRNI